MKRLCKYSNESKAASNAKACDRHGVSDRAAAATATAALIDVGVVTATDYSEVIDRSKVRRSRFKMRELLRSNPQHGDVFGVSILMGEKT